MKNILCLGLAPAIQRTLLFPAFEKGRVNRATECYVSPAGKSVNTGIALRRMGCNPVVAAFNGGMNGRLMSKLMKEWDVPTCFTHTIGETRICTTLIEKKTGVETELVEEARPATKAELNSFVSQNMERLEKCSALVVSGTLPPWIGDDFYVQFMKRAAERNIHCVIDSHGRGLAAVLGLHPTFVKLNREELAATVAHNTGDVVRNARRLMDFGAQHVLVTDGPNPTFLVTPDMAWQFDVSVLESELVVLNPIGSGDCVTAGFLAGIMQGLSLPEAVCLGSGCGCANAITLLPALFDPAVARSLADRITPRPLPF